MNEPKGLIKMPGTPTRKGHAAKWNRTNKTTYEILFEGHEFRAYKSDGMWSLVYIAPELGERIALLDAAATIRGIWNETTDWFKTDGPQVLIDACQAEVEQHRGDAGGPAEAPLAVTFDAQAASARVQQALATVQALTAEADELAQATTTTTTDACPTCGASGDEPCHTKSGKKVKENHGRHANRPV
jgi:hypothetical protein